MAHNNTPQEMVLKRWGFLKQERISWMSHWEELARFFSPRAGRFVEGFGSAASSSSNSGTGFGFVSGTNRGNKRHQHIIDSTPLRSVNVLEAGLLAGMTSPARPWFRLKTPDPKLNERHNVRAWLDNVTRQMRDVFAQSNTYRALRQVYGSDGVFGTAATMLLQDSQDVVRHYPLQIGEYALATNEREAVDTIYRQYDMTVDQLVQRFGYDNTSKRVQGMYDAGNIHHWVPVVHAIEPRRKRDPLKLDKPNMPWASFYQELHSSEGRFLEESGYREFPVMAPRWRVHGRDVYGEAPAMAALGDNKQLQHQQLRKGQAIDFQTNPPLQVPASLTGALEKGPGGVTVVPAIANGQAIRPAWEVNLNLENLLRDMLDVRQRIAQAMFEDMFLLFTTTRRGVQPPTAEEIVAQQEEKLLMIGPILENLHAELLSPLIERTFAIMLRGNLIEPPPAELEGQSISVQFVSTLAQAQALIGLNALDRFIGTLVNLSSVKPSVLDKLDSDKVVDEYSNTLGVDPDLIVANDQVALIREQRANEEQQAKLTAALPAVAKGAKDLGEADPNAANAAVQALNSIGGLP